MFFPLPFVSSGGFLCFPLSTFLDSSIEISFSFFLGFGPWSCILRLIVSWNAVLSSSFPPCHVSTLPKSTAPPDCCQLLYKFRLFPDAHFVGSVMSGISLGLYTPSAWPSPPQNCGLLSDTVRRSLVSSCTVQITRIGCLEGLLTDLYPYFPVRSLSCLSFRLHP